MPDTKQEEALKPPPPKPPHDHPEPIPPHLLKILLELTEKVGKLEGMMKVLLKEKDD